MKRVLLILVAVLFTTTAFAQQFSVGGRVGSGFQALGQYKEAEEWFIRSTHRLPNRIYPYYLLAKLYAEHPEVFPKEKLEWATGMVLERKAKVESTAIRQMREEVKKSKGKEVTRTKVSN